MRKTLKKRHHQTTPQYVTKEDEEQKKQILLLPYVKGVSEKIKHGCHQMGVRAVFKSCHTLRQTLTKVKNKRQDELKSRTVYEVPCKVCDKVYIGETGRSLNDRIKEHKYAVRTGNKKNGIAVHVQESDHPVDWSSAKLRVNEQHLWKRKMLEAIHIKIQDNPSNLDCGLQINPIWLPIIQKERTIPQR